MALVTRDGDHGIAVLSVDGTKVEYTKRNLFSSVRPYQIDTAGNGDVAMVGNIGMSGGDTDTISLIDMRARPIHAVRLVETPAAPAPACSVVRIFGGEDFKSMTVSLSSGIALAGSAGSSFIAPVTSAKLSSGATATLDGGPTEPMPGIIQRQPAVAYSGETIGSKGLSGSRSPGVQCCQSGS
jgi:hypothetical protein